MELSNVSRILINFAKIVKFSLLKLSGVAKEHFCLGLFCHILYDTFLSNFLLKMPTNPSCSIHVFCKKNDLEFD